MFTTALITFREFLEAFIILGAFIGISKSLALKEERSILWGGFIGVLITITITIAIFIAGARLKTFLGEAQQSQFEGLVMIVSGLSLGLIAVSFHSLLHNTQKHHIHKTQLADFSFVSTALLVTLREGLEIALFTAAPALAATFIDNVKGLALGLLMAGLVGFLIYTLSLRLIRKRLFGFLEWALCIMGAAFLGNGIMKLAPFFMPYDWLLIKLPLEFLPSTELFAGHFLRSLTGLSQQTEWIKIIIMLGYIFVIRFLTTTSRRYHVDEPETI